MTFMDEVHEDFEVSAKNAARTLVLWLKTIGAIDSILGLYTIDCLMQIAEEMGWEKVEDEHIGTIIK